MKLLKRDQKFLTIAESREFKRQRRKRQFQTINNSGTRVCFLLFCFFFTEKKPLEYLQRNKTVLETKKEEDDEAQVFLGHKYWRRTRGKSRCGAVQRCRSENSREFQGSLYWGEGHWS